MQLASIIISIFALTVAITTLWLTFLRRGEIKMTKPTVIFFGPDGGESGISKVFIRTLLYSTSRRGIVLENLYVRVRRGETQQNFSIWVYGDSELSRGSGLFIGPEGIATNHHFLTPADVRNFEFSLGKYQLDIFAKILGKTNVNLLMTIDLNISELNAAKLREPGFGIYFDWGPDSGQYQPHIDQRREKQMDPGVLLKAFHKGARDLPEMLKRQGND